MNRTVFYFAAILLHLAVLFLTKTPQYKISLTEQKKYLDVTLTVDSPIVNLNRDSLDQSKPDAPSQDIVAPDQPKPDEITPDQTKPEPPKPEEKKPEEVKPAKIQPLTPANLTPSTPSSGAQSKPSEQPAGSAPDSTPGSNSSSNLGAATTGTPDSNANTSPSGSPGSNSTWTAVNPPPGSTPVAPAAQERAILATPHPSMQIVFVSPLSGGSNSGPSSGGKPGQNNKSSGAGNPALNPNGAKLSGITLSPSGTKMAPLPMSGVSLNGIKMGPAPTLHSGQGGGVGGAGGAGGGGGAGLNTTGLTLTPITLTPITLTPITLTPVSLSSLAGDGLSISGTPGGGQGSGTGGIGNGDGLGITGGGGIGGGGGRVIGWSGPPPAVATPGRDLVLIAGPVVYFAESNGRQGRYFQAINAPDGINWGVAQATAAHHGGYLATLHSTAENDFVFTLIDDPKYWVGSSNGDKTNLGPWLGGVRATDSTLPEDGWIWLKDGSPFTYNNWSVGLPNRGSKADNDYLRFFSDKINVRRPTWSDAGPNELMRGFVVEFNNDPQQ